MPLSSLQWVESQQKLATATPDLVASPNLTATKPVIDILCVVANWECYEIDYIKLSRFSKVDGQDITCVADIDKDGLERHLRSLDPHTSRSLATYHDDGLRSAKCSMADLGFSYRGPVNSRNNPKNVAQDVNIFYLSEDMYHDEGWRHVDKEHQWEVLLEDLVKAGSKQEKFYFCVAPPNTKPMRMPMPLMQHRPESGMILGSLEHDPDNQTDWGEPSTRFGKGFGRKGKEGFRRHGGSQFPGRGTRGRM